MRNWSWLLISARLVLACAAAAGARRRGRSRSRTRLSATASTLAEVTDGSSTTDGNYQITETLEGQGHSTRCSARAKRIEPGHDHAGRPAAASNSPTSAPAAIPRAPGSTGRRKPSRMQYKGRHAHRAAAAERARPALLPARLAFAPQRREVVSYTIVRRARTVASRLYESAAASGSRCRSASSTRCKVRARQRRRARRALARGRARLSAGASAGHGERRHALRAGGDQASPRREAGAAACCAHAAAALSRAAASSPRRPTRRLSRYFRAHRELGQQERAFVADAAFAVLRRRRSLEAAAGSSAAARRSSPPR